MAAQVVIVGAGTGGTMVANLLDRRLAGTAVTITVIAEDGEHVFQPANLDAAFRGAPPERFVRAQRPLLRRRVRLVSGGADRVDFEEKVVRMLDGREIPFDIVVLATGAVARPDAMPGLADAALDFHTGPRRAARIWRALETFRAGRIVVAIASVPYKCPPSPVEAVFLLDDLFRARGARDDVEIRLVTPYPRAYPAGPIADVVEPRLVQRGIEVTSFFNMEAADRERGVITSLEGEEVPYDLLLAVPPHRGADVVTRSGLGDAEGWIATDRETMRVAGRTDAFALGDCTNIPISKSGVVAHLQADVVAKNVARQLGAPGDETAYEGRINCPMEVGGGRALFVSATYAAAPLPQRPTVVRFAMKRTFGRMYWSVLGGGYEWMFRLYFGPTSHPKRARTAALAAPS